MSFEWLEAGDKQVVLASRKSAEKVTERTIGRFISMLSVFEVLV